MFHEAHSDHGTVLRSDQMALIANGDGSFSLYLPRFPEGATVPLSMQLLAAVAARIDDEEWIADMLRGLNLE